MSQPFSFLFLFTSHLALSDNTYRNQVATTQQLYPHFILYWFFIYVLTSSLFNPHHWHPKVASTIQNLQYALPTSSAHASVFKTALLLFKGRIESSSQVLSILL